MDYPLNGLSGLESRETVRPRLAWHKASKGKEPHPDVCYPLSAELECIAAGPWRAANGRQ